MLPIEIEYNQKLNLIAQWLKTANVDITLAVGFGGHRSLRFRHKGIEHEINGVVGPKVAQVVLPERMARMIVDGSAMPDEPVKSEIVYVDGPVLMGVWVVPGNHQLFLDKDPLAVAEFVLHDL